MTDLVLDRDTRRELARESCRAGDDVAILQEIKAKVLDVLTAAKAAAPQIAEHNASNHADDAIAHLTDALDEFDAAISDRSRQLR